MRSLTHVASKLNGDTIGIPYSSMADARHDEDGPPYLTFTELRIAGERVPLFSEAYERLTWPISGEFPSAISVVGGTHVEPLFNSATGEWHDIASHPITRKRVSGLEASLTNLESWDRKWERLHEEHADPAWEGCEYVTYGDLNNDVRPFAVEPEREDGTWSWDEPSDKEILVRCCGEERPLGKKGLMLEVRPSPGNDFITIKDYVGGE
jgi:hypothetical protein